VPAFQKLGVVAMRAGSRLPGNTPNNLYPTRDGQYVHITAASDAVFRRLAQTIGKPEMITDERFATAIARIENEDAVDDTIGAWTAQRDGADVEKTLRAAKVPASHIYTIADIFNDPHYAARSMLASVPDNELGNVTLANVVPRLLQTPGGIRHSGGRVGQDTMRVLREITGMNEMEIDALKKRGTISCDPHTVPARDVEASEAS
jgi:crotonobetainyl-CoA:carnitine CoA-transferase CaiB-like acyl-CoA transferase